MTAAIRSSTNSELDEIDEEIAGYEDAIRKLRSRRNSLVPISKLPAEILCAIFMFIPTHGPTPLRYRWHWITITHISHLWRTISLNCPELWSTPDFTKPNLASEMIKRSKMAPLNIEVTSNSWLTPWVLKTVGESLKQITRINEIHLLASRNNMDKLLSGINYPAPLLGTLILDLTDYYLSERYIIPQDFLADDASRLYHIDLTGCHLRWDSSLLRNLAYFKVRNPGPPAPTLDQLLSVLTAMPQLEELDLEKCLPKSLPGNTSTNATGKSRITLPNLRNLRITGALEECVTFLEHVHIPTAATTHVRATCSQIPQKGSTTLVLINQVCQRLPLVRGNKNMPAPPGTRVPVIKSLLVHLSSRLYIQAWDDIPSEVALENVSPGSFAHASTAGWFKIEFAWEHTLVMDHLIDDVVAAICSPLPLLQLSNLHIDNSYSESSSYPACAKTFGSLPQITTLTIDGMSGHEKFVGAYTDVRDIAVASDRVNSGSGHLTLFFPALHTLKLVDTDFDRPNHAQGATLLYSLLDYHVYREKLQRPIHKLYLEDCTHLTSEKVDELKKVVDVRWDKVEHGYEDENGYLSPPL
ncbi:hypothetical protein BT96DRAFT_860443 [Gymnopus androsaceus JB14]|uniref:Uncharacterized protein n=1 Tax=Gymnopus androsaceus JB14 TaxID=1447944 RepID=A0A6A4HH94_9AGAR|nr:hypothetical protein BT96DRAFT_860443 [Gymnopus androsaceus JB14]